MNCVDWDLPKIRVYNIEISIKKQHNTAMVHELGNWISKEAISEIYKRSIITDEMIQACSKFVATDRTKHCLKKKERHKNEKETRKRKFFLFLSLCLIVGGLTCKDKKFPICELAEEEEPSNHCSLQPNHATV